MDNLDKIFNQAIEQKVFPGAVIGILADDKITTQAFGGYTYEKDSKKVTTDTPYDLASITKCMPTASLVLYLIDQKKLNLEDKVVDFIPDLKTKYRADLKIKHLLTYTATFNLPRMSEIAKNGGQAVLDATFNAELIDAPGNTFIYSNVVSTLLAMIVQKVSGVNFYDFANQVFFAPLGMNHTTFKPKNAPPTEIENGKLVQNVVHDESARALIKDNLTCGHAGLFSTAEDLLKFARMLLNGGSLDDKRYFSPQTAQLFYTNQLSGIGKIFGAGWSMKNSPIEGFNFMGEAPSAQAFGMTGFTGTSIVIDPTKKRALVILSNATFPTRKDDKNIMNSVRRDVADIIFG